MYKITIEKIENEKVTKKGEYAVVEKRPYTQAELDEANNGFIKDDTEPQSLKSVYGYLPEYEVIREKKTDILEQSVEDLDVVAVIKAINKIGADNV